MQTKVFLVLGAILAPLVAAVPAVNDGKADSALKERKMDPLFEIMAWKEGLDEILKNAAKEKSNTNEHHNGGWSHPIWPYE
ncbi:hypothetical protein NUW58_g3859 [Xylaria curta]|uniref:Uncharacterized protein n=1 Tax=Xylaria curta TaxID=42375 RepID=A0ACC1PBB3_9PEZI|nr:hypothetical protein NUW58_g3859 [Xylaria curta]